MKRFAITSRTLASLALAVTCLTYAQSRAEGQVQFVLAQDLVKQNTENGKPVEVIIPSPQAVMPGDILREEVTLKNVSGKALNNVQVSVPVPRGTEFTGNASLNRSRWNLLYSADNGKTFSETPTHTVTVTENGKTVTKKVTAPTGTYTNVRWIVTTLKPDESLKLSFRVKVK